METPLRSGRAIPPRLLLWIVPCLFCLAVYWPGLMAWFQKDDFAWLGLRWGIHSWRDLGWALFAPQTEGTIRPWSHGGFFLTLSALFGVHAFPFRVVAFLTQFANLTLLAAIATKLTGSRRAGFWAAILWIANSALATAMSWTSAYNVILCAFFILLGFWLFLRYVETGRQRYYTAQFLVFVLGFGALETNLVYPVLLAAYTLGSNRKYFGKVIPLLAVSVAYTVLHLWITKLPASGPYRPYFDQSIFSTLWMYWKSALGPNRLAVLGIFASPWRSLMAAVLMLALVGFLIDRLRERDWVVALFPVWFVATLAPVLPLRDQFQMQYLTVPSIGLAMWGAAALVRGWHSGGFYRLVAALVLALYLGVSLPVAVMESRAWNRESQWVRHKVLSVVEAARKGPETLVLLAGVNDQMFKRLIYYRPFGAYGMWDVYLTPDTRASASFLPPPELLRQARAHQKLQILEIADDSVKDITAEARRSCAEPLP